MKKRLFVILTLVVMTLALAASASAGRQIGPGDGDLGCGPSNLGQYASWGGHTFLCYQSAPFTGTYQWLQIS